MYRLPDELLSRLLSEDMPHGDLTTHLLGIGSKPAAMTFAARGAMVVACIEEAARIVELAGGWAEMLVASGDAVADQGLLLRAEGSAESLLAAWKVAQTLVEQASGIASAVRRMVEAAASAGGATIACTRKSFPGTRAVSLKAVLAGGGVPHRLGLSDTILVFPEHRAFMAGDLAGYLLRLRQGAPEKRLVAEAATHEDALLLAEAGIDVLQLEKFPPEQVALLAQSLAGFSPRPVIAAAGGVNAKNAEAYVRAGAGVLVTSAPYNAPPAEVQVRIHPSPV
ncbi:MAG TPA: ModD protein [Candidatus Sulfotelmatobacter sp.]|jgi:molybdenum transport protein|nr:ModD protein [Candidatus Sulfotelmatobacter sp.]